MSSPTSKPNVPFDTWRSANALEAIAKSLDSIDKSLQTIATAMTPPATGPVTGIAVDTQAPTAH